MRNRTPFQFSIRTMLAATAMVSAGAAAVCAKPSVASALAIDFLSVLFATVAILAVMQTSGNGRAFWAGTAVLLNLAAFVAVESAIINWPLVGKELGPLFLPPDPICLWFETDRNLWHFWCAALINGLLAVLLRWVFWPKRSKAHSLRKL